MMKKIVLLLAAIVLSTNFSLRAQMSGTYPVPSTFSTIAAAISSINAVGVNGPVIIDIAAGYTETAPAGGYSLGVIAGASAANTITFQKAGAGANPLITAYTGTAIPSSAVQDGVWWLVGSDFVTIDGIDITDPNTSNPATMEFGYGLYKAGVTDGCQNNTIRNCVITLKAINNAAGAGPATDGSRGIDVMNATPSANTVALTITSAAGSNSNNKFYSNTIQNCNIGIAMIGFAASTPFALADNLNEIGGTTATSGNTILNFGGGGTVASAGIRTLAQYGIKVSYNVLNSNNGAGTLHAGVLRGILLGTAASANATINNNTVTVKGGGTSQQLTAIENNSGSTAASNTISITGNLVTDCTYSTATSGVFYGIFNNATPAALAITTNTTLNNSTSATSGSYYNIYNSAAVVNDVIISNNLLNLGSFNATSTSLNLGGIYNSGGSSTCNWVCNSNIFQNANFAGTTGGTGTSYLIYNSGTHSLTTISTNTFNSVVLKNSTTAYIIHNSNGTNNSIVTGNISNGFNKTVGGGTVYGYYNFGSPSGGTASITANSFINNTVTAATTFYGIYQATSTSQLEHVIGNLVGPTAGGTSAMYGIYHSYGASGSSVGNNTITGLSSGGTIYGISHGNTASAVMNVYGNSVNTFSTTGASTVYGIYQAGGTTAYSFRNKVYDLSGSNAGSIVFGIYVAGGTTTGIFNNLIGDLKATAASAANAVSGIYLNGGTAAGIYYNSVNLAAASSGANFGTSGLYAATSVSVDVRNNIFKNTSTPAGTGITVAYRRSGTSLTTFSATSNNNSYYAGTPGTSNLILYDGTNSYQTISAYQAAVSPRESASFTENTPFLSVVGLSSNFLHINTTSPSQTESGGVNITGITDDYDLQVRQGNAGYAGTGTAPDVGADEYNQNLPVCATPNAGTISPTSFTRCAGQSVALVSTGFSQAGGISHLWKVATSTGGPYTAVSGGSGSTTVGYTSGGLSTGTLFYILETTCSVTATSAISNEATVTVNAVPTASVASSNSVYCSGQNVILTGSTNIGTSFMWNGPSGFTSTAANNTIAVAGTTASGVYALVTSNSNCTNTPVTLSITVLPTPSALTLTPVSASICAGSGQSITVTGGSVPVSLNFGSQTNTNTASTGSAGYPAPYTAYYGGQKMQMLILATELQNAGFTTGSNFSNIQFPVISLGGNWGTSITSNNNFQVNIGATNLTSLATFQTGLTNVVAPANFVPTVGYNNTHLFSSPFVWDGTSNIILETTFSNNFSGGTADLVSQYNSPTTFQSTLVYRADSQTASAIAASTSTSYAYSARPDFRLNGAKIGNLLWTPSSGLSSTTSPTVVASPSTTTTYTVAASLSSCSASNNITVNVTPTPTVLISASTDTICAGDPVILTAVAADSYTWVNTNSLSNTILDNPVINTTYTVLGQIGNCPAVPFTYSITVNPSPSVTAVASSPSVCVGQTVILTAGGADAYIWSTGPSGSVISVSPQSGPVTYSVLGTNTLGCSKIATVSIAVNPLPAVTINPFASPVCANDTLIITATGASTYSWTNGPATASILATPAVNTTYTVTGTDLNGCFNAALAQVNVNALPVILTTATNTDICFGDVVTLMASGGTSYTWNPTATGPNYTVTPATTTIYTVTGMDPNGCMNTASVTILVNVCTALENGNADPGLSLYPNPTSGLLVLSAASEGERMVQVTDISGKVVFESQFTDAKNTIDLNVFAKGIYYIRVSGAGTINTYKVVLQ